MFDGGSSAASTWVGGGLQQRSKRAVRAGGVIIQRVGQAVAGQAHGLQRSPQHRAGNILQRGRRLQTQERLSRIILQVAHPVLQSACGCMHHVIRNEPAKWIGCAALHMWMCASHVQDAPVNQVSSRSCHSDHNGNTRLID